MKMTKPYSVILIALFILLFTACAPHVNRGSQKAAQQHPAKNATLSAIIFPISCSAKAQAEFERGLALVHHMMYVEAEKQFTTLSKKEPDCAMAYWGIAMTQFHPLWPGQTRDAALHKGWEAIQKAQSLHPPTQREQAYIHAIELLYKDTSNLSQSQRISAWETAQKQILQQYPDDTEAAVFYALAHLATAPKGDQNYSHQKHAGALLEQLRVSKPQHPGVLHYTIHAYDNQLLAPRAVDAAYAYDKVAPDVPHALHMPTHIFVRLGNWDKVVDLNARSAKAALKYPVKEAISHHNPHALDYLVYAFLQQSKDDNAKKVLRDIQATDNYQQSFVSGYALAAIPARYYLERRQWQQAANLPVHDPKSFPWQKYPELEAITYFARGLGAARSGDVAAAQAALEKLNNLYQQTNIVGQNYWTIIIDAQRKTVAAWIAFARGKETASLRMMQNAANVEDSVNKHPVTPGAILPARELLGDMLLLSGKYKQAFAAYQQSLKISPNRFNGLYGAGRAAELSGDASQAKLYYAQFIQLSKNEKSRPESNQVIIYLSGN